MVLFIAVSTDTTSTSSGYRGGRISKHCNDRHDMHCANRKRDIPVGAQQGQYRYDKIIFETRGTVSRITN